MSRRKVSPFLTILGFLAAQAGAARADDLRFVDVTDQTGLQFENHSPPAAGRSSPAAWIGTGAAVADYDGDGDLDIYFVDSFSWPNQLWQNNGDKTFTNVTDASGLGSTSGGRMALWLDLDNDGDSDLVVLNDTQGGETDLPSQVFRNDDGVFTDVSEGSGFIPTGPYGGGMAATDYNADGLLDIYVTFWNDSKTVPPYNFLYRNRGDFTFVEETETMGLRGANTQAQTWSPVFFDFDGDGDQDLYGAVDFDLDYLYLLGPDGFTDVSEAANVFHDGQDAAANDMGVAIGDIDHDDDLDIFTTNIAAPIEGGGKFNALFVNNWPAPCTDEASDDERNVWRSYWGWGTCFADLDFDKDIDLVTVNGRTEDPDALWTNRPKQIFKNDGTGYFTDVGPLVGLDHLGNSRGLVAFDYDNDSDEDLLITNVSQSFALYENTTVHTNHYLKIKLEGTARTKEAIGAKVRVTAGGTTQLRELLAGGSFLASLPRELIFGVGDATQVETVDITWPCGGTTVLSNVAVDQTLAVVEDTLTRPTGLVISGPSSIESNSAATFSAAVSFGCAPDVAADEVVWSVESSDGVAIDDSGNLTVGALDELRSVEVRATLGEVSAVASVRVGTESPGDVGGGTSDPPSSPSGGCGSVGMVTLVSCLLWLGVRFSGFKRRFSSMTIKSNSLTIVWFLVVSLAGTLVVSGCTSAPDAPADNDSPSSNNSNLNSNENESSDNASDNTSDNSSADNDNVAPTCVPACDAGEECRDGVCVAVNLARVEVGFTDEDTDEYSIVSDGAVMPIFTFGQGGAHMFATLRVTGIAPDDDGTLLVTYIMIDQADSSALAGFEEVTDFVSLGENTFEAKRRIVFISRFPEVIDGATVDLRVIVESPTDSEERVSIEQSLLLEFRDE